MKKLIYIIIAIVIAFLAIGLKPIDITKSNSTKVTGIVKSISEGGVKDLIFELENDKITYYINRGLENGFQLEKSKNDFVGKIVSISYAKNWTPLAPFGTTSKHIVEILVDDKTIYSEFE